MGDSVLALMKAIREAHGMTQLQVAMEMGIAQDTYRHIEKGRRPLPDVRNGELGKWMRSFLDAVDAAPDERQYMKEVVSRLVLHELSDLLDDDDPPDEGPSDPP
ncbi:MAG TPA: helix-turn-helix transcriptional regulator [Ktedonobacterales bacterium]|jgi:transcriptional regulator with XRE-family HTH domain